jgi:hypothetical protein
VPSEPPESLHRPPEGPQLIDWWMPKPPVDLVKPAPRNWWRTYWLRIVGLAAVLALTIAGFAYLYHLINIFLFR